MQNDSIAAYNGMSRFNHWLTALVVIAMLAAGFMMAEEILPKEAEKSLKAIHKATGVLFLIFVVWRVGHRLSQGFLAPLSGMPAWQEKAARFVHWALLAAIVVMPVSGLTMSIFSGKAVDVFGIFSVPAMEKNKAIAGIAHETHEILGPVLLALVVVHILAALKHHFKDRDATLARMTGRDVA